MPLQPELAAMLTRYTAHMVRWEVLISSSMPLICEQAVAPVRHERRQHRIEPGPRGSRKRQPSGDVSIENYAVQRDM